MIYKRLEKFKKSATHLCGFHHCQKSILLSFEDVLTIHIYFSENSSKCDHFEGRFTTYQNIAF